MLQHKVLCVLLNAQGVKNQYFAQHKLHFIIIK